MNCPFCVDGVMASALPVVVERAIRMKCGTCGEVLLGPLGRTGSSARFWASTPNPQTVANLD